MKYSEPNIYIKLIFQWQHHLYKVSPLYSGKLLYFSFISEYTCKAMIFMSDFGSTFWWKYSQNFFKGHLYRRLLKITEILAIMFFVLVLFHIMRNAEALVLLQILYAKHLSLDSTKICILCCFEWKFPATQLKLGRDIFRNMCDEVYCSMLMNHGPIFVGIIDNAYFSEFASPHREYLDNSSWNSHNGFLGQKFSLVYPHSTSQLILGKRKRELFSRFLLVQFMGS